MTVYEQARQALRDHDRSYMQSDDHRTFRRGAKEAADITALLDKLEIEQVAQLADEFRAGDYPGEPLNVFIAMRFHDAQALRKAAV